MNQKRKTGKAYKSPSTGQSCDCAQYLAELMLIRRSERENVGNLGYKFWNEAHKDSYKGQVVAARRLIKKFGEKLLLSFINSKGGQGIFSLGFFAPLDFVVLAIEKHRPLFEKEQSKLEQQILDTHITKVEENKAPEVPYKKFVTKKNIFSKIKSLEKKNGEKNEDTQG